MDLKTKDYEKEPIFSKNNGLSKPPHILQLLSYFLFFGIFFNVIFIFTPLCDKATCVIALKVLKLCIIDLLVTNFYYFHNLDTLLWNLLYFS